MDSRVIVAAKMLQIVFDLTKSDSGFIAQVEKADNEKVFFFFFHILLYINF